MRKTGSIRLRFVLVALAAVLVAPVTAWTGTARAAGTAPITSGLEQTSSSTYVVDPAAGAVHVTVDLTAKNVVPDRTTSRGVERTYYFAVTVVAPAEATNFSATSGTGSSLPVSTNPTSEIASLVEVHYPNLYYGHTQVVQLRFDLPNGAPRSHALTRVTPAFASFAAWVAGSYGGTGSVTIVVPRAFTVDIVGETMTKHATGATVTYSAANIAHPLDWFVTVSARDDAKLVTKDVTTSGHAVEIRGFPDDPAWATFVQSRLRTGFPALEQLIGLPWPSGPRLTVTETATPYLYGYAGWYSTSDNSIEIGDQLDGNVVLHEVSHAWFNERLFDERWIDEGLAQEYAARAVAATGGALTSPKAVNPRDPVAVRLEAWTSVDPKADNSQAREAFGYNASWYVIRQVTNEIGVAGMRRVLVAANKQALPYAGDPKTPAENPEAAGGAGSWKRFLDYLDQTGGARQADALFAKYVALPGDTSIARRGVARAAYHLFQLQNAGWAPPLVLREAMTNWDFPAATKLMATARRIGATGDAIQAVVSPLGLDVPSTLRTDYAYRTTDLDAVQTEANADLAAAKTLRNATKAVDGGHGLLAKIGLLGASHKSDLRAARVAFVKGDTAATTRAATAAEKTVHDANGAGALRIAIAIVVIIVLALLTWRVVRWRRRRATRRDGADPTASGPDSAPGNGEVAAGFAG